MKNASQIINIIQSKPQFSKLHKAECIKKIQSLFTQPVQKMIKFAYFKENTLFFVFNHPAGKQEFDNNIQNIKNALNFAKPSECLDYKLENIKAFVTHTPIKEPIFETKVSASYPERSQGNFEVNINDTKLRSLILSIKNIIKLQIQREHDTP